jgi:hypothetical protein
MRSISWQQVAQRRRENFLVIAKKFDAINEVQWELGEQDVPMCYPLVLRRELGKIKTAFAAQNIFIPIYWQDALPRIAPDSIEARYIHQTLFLPIDQRIESAQAEKLGALILDMIKVDI